MATLVFSPQSQVRLLSNAASALEPSGPRPCRDAALAAERRPSLSDRQAIPLRDRSNRDYEGRAVCRHALRYERGACPVIQRRFTGGVSRRLVRLNVLDRGIQRVTEQSCARSRIEADGQPRCPACGVLELLRVAGFDPEAIEIIYETYVKTCRSVSEISKPDPVNEFIALQRLLTRQQGERNPDRLRAGALAALLNVHYDPKRRTLCG